MAVCPDPTHTARTVVSGSNVSVSFGTTHALAGVSIEVENGEVLGIAGPSGSGKSTLLYCLAGLLVPDRGEITLCDKVIDQLSGAERAHLRLHRCGFVFQFGHLLPELTAVDNVALPLRLQGVARKDARGRAGRLLDRLGLGDCVDQLPGTLSGGQMQRVVVARATVAEPTVVFADEPTGSLDSHNGQRVITELVAAARVNNSAVVIASHDDDVLRQSDRVVHLLDGRITP